MINVYLGRINIHMSDLPNGQPDDQWHQLLGGGAKTAKGNVRLVANFKDLVILPLDEYKSLKDVSGQSKHAQFCIAVVFSLVDIG